MAEVSFTLNGTPTRITVDESRMLLWVLRDDLGLTGTKFGCGESVCGACTVLVNDQPVRSCATAMKDVRGKRVITIEGLAKNGTLHPVQQAFVDHDALQCGFCTPGMILTGVALLTTNPQPTREQIIHGLDQNFCRCGAHTRIVDALQAAATHMKGSKS